MSSGSSSPYSGPSSPPPETELSPYEAWLQTRGDTPSPVPTPEPEPLEAPTPFKDHPLFTEINKFVKAWDEPAIEPMIQELQSNMATLSMMNRLAEAQMAILAGDLDSAEAKINTGLDAAMDLRDGDYIKRCQDLMLWLEEEKEGAAMRREMKERGDDADDEGENGVENHTSRRIQGTSRQSSPASGPELLGEFLEDSGGDGEWNFDEDGKYEQQEGEADAAPKFERASTSRPETPRTPSPPSNERRRRRQRSRRTIPKQPQAFTESDPGSEHSWSSYDSDPGNEEEDHLDSDDTIEASDSDSNSEDNSAVRLLATGKRPLPPIANTTLTKTLLYKPLKPINNSALRRRPEPNANTDRRRGPQISTSRFISKAVPKPWHQPTSNTDSSTTPSLPYSFWNTHNKTLLLRSEVPDWDMDWLTRYNASPFQPAKSAFTFRSYPPMSSMASRVRPTKIFKEQECEFIPAKRQWKRFVNGCHGDGEKMSMGFLRWERDRVERLVGEKRDFMKKPFLKRVYLSVDWVRLGMLLGVALLLVVFWFYYMGKMSYYEYYWA